jgi:hypothetical protein
MMGCTYSCAMSVGDLRQKSGLDHMGIVALNSRDRSGI